MNSERTANSILLLILGLVVASSTFAGGPRTIGVNGHVIKWNPGEPVHFLIDRGRLGFSLTNEGAADLVEMAMDKWNAINSSASRPNNSDWLRG